MSTRPPVSRTTSRVGAVALGIFSVASIAWFALELTPPRLGFEDTDDPSVSLEFLREHTLTYAVAGLALFAMAAGLLVGSIALTDRLIPGPGSLVGRVATATAYGSALFFFGQGVLRSSVRPLLYVEGLDAGWGESAYLVLQMAGVHGFAQGGIVLFCTWVVVMAVAGRFAGTLPRWLALLAVLPALRLVTSLLGPVGVLGDLGVLWVLSLAAIPGSMLWPLAAGIWLWYRPSPQVSGSVSGL